MQNAIKLSQGTRLSKSEAKKTGEEPGVEEEGNGLLLEAAGQYEEPGEGGLLVNVESSLEADPDEETEDQDESFAQDKYLWGGCGFMIGRGLNMMGLRWVLGWIGLDIVWFVWRN